MDRRAGLPAAHLVPQAALGGHRILFLALLREDHLLLPRLLRPHRAVKVLGKEESSHIPFRAPKGSMFQASLRFTING